MIISSLEGSLQSQSRGVLTVTTVGMGEEDDRTGFCLFFKMRKGFMLLFFLWKVGGLCASGFPRPILY